MDEDDVDPNQPHRPLPDGSRRNVAHYDRLQLLRERDQRLDQKPAPAEILESESRRAVRITRSLGAKIQADLKSEEGVNGATRDNMREYTRLLGMLLKERREWVALQVRAGQSPEALNPGANDEVTDLVEAVSLLTPAEFEKALEKRRTG